MGTFDTSTETITSTGTSRSGAPEAVPWIKKFCTPTTEGGSVIPTDAVLVPEGVTGLVEKDPEKPPERPTKLSVTGSANPPTPFTDSGMSVSGEGEQTVWTRFEPESEKPVCMRCQAENRVFCLGEC